MPPEPGKTDPAGFYRATLAPLRRYLARILRNEADAADVAQDAYTKVLPEMEKDRVEKPEAYLYTTARRLAINQLRRRGTTPADSVDHSVLDQAPSPAPGVAQTVIARHELATVERAMEQLPPGCRAVLLLRRVELLSHEEIARRLGVTVSNVEKQQARALRLLRAALAAAETTPFSQEAQP
jgi:RNA polymerase sigma-70 factor (ECF subfamily)